MNTNTTLKTARNHVVSIADVLYLQALGNYTALFLISKQKIVAAFTLKYYQDILLENGFIRPNKSFIIHPNFILSVNFHNKTITLKDEQIIQISRRKLPLLLPILKHTVNNKMNLPT